MAFRLEPTDPDFVTSAPQRYVYVMELPVPPDKVWDGLVADSPLPWVRGLSIEWTSPRPFDVGTSRIARGGFGAIRLHERYVVWEEGYRNSFVVERANVPLFRRFAEDYLVEPTPDGCRFTWTFAVEPRGPRAVAAVDNLIQRGMFAQMAADTRRHFGR